MKILITGAHGTVGSELKKYLHALNHALNIEVLTWDRNCIPINVYNLMEEFLREVRPDIVFHLAAVVMNTCTTDYSWSANYEWTGELAWITKILTIKFMYTSTAMVFSPHAQGPFTVYSRPDATEGYGYEKRRSEERVLYQNPEATIVRLGWQIGEEPGSNNMIDYFDRHMKQHGHIEASTRWQPACSFLADTVETLFALTRFPSGLYMLDSNEKWNFYEIACALNELHGNKWNIVPTHEFIYDQRLFDEKVKMSSLKKRLRLLR